MQYISLVHGLVRYKFYGREATQLVVWFKQQTSLDAVPVHSHKRIVAFVNKP